MTKTLGIILFVALSSFFTVVQQNTVTADFERVEDGMYYFTTKAKDSYSFHGIAESAKAKYDLFEDRYKGKTFTLSYETRVIEEEDEEPIEEVIITDIKLIE